MSLSPLKPEPHFDLYFPAVYLCSMKIKAVCFSHLAVYHSSDGYLEVSDSIRVDDVPELLGFQKDEVAMYFVGDSRVDVDYELADGDVLKLFPPITGG